MRKFVKDENIRVYHMKFTTYILCAILLSCGYFEDDHVSFEKKLLGKISLRKQNNDDAVNLVFVNSKQNSTVIVNNCKTVFLDSLNKIIYAEKYLNPYNSSFYIVSLKNYPKEDAVDGFNVREIAGDQFDQIVDKGKGLVYEKK